MGGYGGYGGPLPVSPLPIYVFWGQKGGIIPFAKYGLKILEKNFQKNFDKIGLFLYYGNKINVEVSIFINVNNINQYKKRFHQLMESSMGDVKPLIDEQGGIIRNLIGTGAKKLPQTFKYAKEINHLIKPEIKTLISVEKPLVKFSESTVQKFYNLFWTDSKYIQKDLKSIKPFDIGLTQDGQHNLIELQRNSNKLETFINTKVGGELNLKDYVETIYSMKNQSDNLVNELSIINAKSPSLQTAKNIQARINDIVKKNEELLSKAAISKSAGNKPKPAKPQTQPAKPQTQPAKPQTQPAKPHGNFKTIRIERDKFGFVTNTKISKFIDGLFEKVFYEGLDKRHGMFSKEVISKLTPNTKSYLKQLKDMVESKGLLGKSQMSFKDTYGRLPKTIDEEIEMISGNIWGGGGRRGGIQLQLDEFPIPSSDVIENLMNVTMSPYQKNEVLELYKRIFGP